MTKPLPQATLKTVHACINCAFIFFLLNGVLTFFFYCVANYQDLSENTVRLLLRLLFLDGVFLVVFSLLTGLFTVFAWDGRTHRKLPVLVKHILFAATGVAFFLFAGLVMAFSGGNG